MNITDILLAEFTNDIKRTKAVLERIDEDKFEWRPHPKSWNMGELATHIANIPSWVKMTCEVDTFDMNPSGGEQPKTEPLKTQSEILTAFDNNCEEAIQVLTALNESSIHGDWTLLSGGNVIFTAPRLSVLREFVINHLIHHRAQLTVYLRLNEIPVPAIYGPSADESGM